MITLYGKNYQENFYHYKNQYSSFEELLEYMKNHQNVLYEMRFGGATSFYFFRNDNGEYSISINLTQDGN